MGISLIAETSSWDDFKKWWTGHDSGAIEDAVRYYDQHPLISPALSIVNSVIGVIDIKKMRYLYVSANIKEFSGWTREDYYQKGVEFAFNNIHPDDQPGMIQFSELINNYFKNLSVHDKKLYRAFWSFSIRDPTGAYTKIIQQDCVLRYDDRGLIEELLFFCFKIDNVMTGSHQYLRLTNRTENLLYRYDHSRKKVIQLETLSTREMEIAKLIAKSTSLKQIAGELGISFNTVKSHVTKMTQKLQVNGSLEMVNLLRVCGFI